MICMSAELGWNHFFFNNLFYQKITKNNMSQSFAQIFALYKNKIRAASIPWCAEYIERAWSSSSPSSSPWGVLSIYGYLSVTSQGIVCLMPFLVKLRFICLLLVKGLSVFCLISIYGFFCLLFVKGLSVLSCLGNIWLSVCDLSRGFLSFDLVLLIYGSSVWDLSRGFLPYDLSW